MYNFFFVSSSFRLAVNLIAFLLLCWYCWIYSLCRCDMCALELIQTDKNNKVQTVEPVEPETEERPTNCRDGKLLCPKSFWLRFKILNEEILIETWARELCCTVQIKIKFWQNDRVYFVFFRFLLDLFILF